MGLHSLSGLFYKTVLKKIVFEKRKVVEMDNNGQTENENKVKKNRLTINYIYNVSFQIFSMLVPFISTPYISRVLGVEMVGVYSYTLSISTYFIVAGSLGFPLYGQREIAYCSNNFEERSKKFFEILYGQLFLLTFVLLLYYGFIFLTQPAYKEVYLAQSIGIIGGVLATSWFYIGIEEFRVTVAKNFIVKIISLAGLFVFVKETSDVVLYAVIIGMANLLGNLTILIDIRKYVGFSYLKVSARDVLKHIKPAFLLGIPYYITSVYAIIDKTMLGLLGGGYVEIGYYEQSQKIVTLVITIITSIGTVLMPRLANELSNEHKNKVKLYINKGVEYSVLMAAPIMCGLLVISLMIVPWFYGAGYEQVGVLLKIFSPLVLILGIENLIGAQYLTVTKRERDLTIIIMIGVIINCGMNLILIPFMDSTGAAIATVVSELIRLIIHMVLVKTVIDIPHFAKILFRYMSVSLLMSAVVLGLRNTFFSFPNMFNSLALIIIGCLVYFGFLIALRDDITMGLISKIMKKY